MEPVLPAAGLVTGVTGASVPLEPGVQVVTDPDPEVVGVAVLAAGRLGAELDVPVAVVQDGAADEAAAQEGAPPAQAAPAGALLTTGPGVIRLRLVDQQTLDLPETAAHDQGYRLTIGVDRIDLAAVTPTGLAHAVATLVRLAASSRTRADRAARRPPRLPVLTLRDHPWLRWRGVAVDLAAEPLGVEGLRVVLGVMSALRLGVLRLPGMELAALGSVGYGEVRAAAAARRVELVPGVTTSPGAVGIGELVASTRARWVDVGGRTDDPAAARRRVEDAIAAGAGALVDQAAAAAVAGLGDVVLVVRDVQVADDVAAVRRAVARGARVVLAVPRRPTEQPLLEAAVAVDRAVAALDLPYGALLGVEAVPGAARAGRPGHEPGGSGASAEQRRAGALLPWMTAIAEVGWTPPA